MKHLKRFNESIEEQFDVEKEELKEWLGYFLDEYPELKLEIHEWRSFDPKAAFNIIITFKGESEDILTDETPLILEKDFPIKPHLQFLNDRLKERGLKVSFYDYGMMWSMLKIGVEKI